MRKPIIVFGLLAALVGVALGLRGTWVQRTAIVIPPDLQAAIVTIPPVRALPPEMIPTGKNLGEQLAFQMERHPEHREVMSRFQSALEMTVADQAAVRLSMDIGSVFKDGWQAASPELIDFMTRAEPQLDALLGAVGPVPFPAPPAMDYPKVFEDLLHIQNLYKVLICRAYQVAVDDPARGVDVLLRTAMLSLSFCNTSTPLGSHLIGGVGINMSVFAAAKLIRDPRITPDQAREIDRNLGRLESQWGGAGLAFRGEFQTQLTLTRNYFANKSLLSKEGRAGFKKFTEGRNFATLESDYDPAYRALIAYYSRPAHQRSPELPPGLQAPFLPADVAPFYATAVGAMDRTLTVLRLCRALARDRYGVGEKEPGMPEDPFSTQPILASDLAYWSIGPDKQSDGGVLKYDPTNGSVSTGDIVVQR
jgi:hypothetical protein